MYVCVCVCVLASQSGYSIKCYLAFCLLGGGVPTSLEDWVESLFEVSQ